MAEYKISPSRSTIEILGKSSLHPIHGALRDGVLSGTIVAEVVDGSIDVTASPQGRVELPVEGLSFGNSLYDRELPKRLQTRSYPLIVVELESIEPTGASGEHHFGLTLTLHGVTKSFDERAHVEIPDGETITVIGEHTFDVRDFDIEPPKKLGMKVHPDFLVKVSLVGERAAS